VRFFLGASTTGSDTEVGGSGGVKVGAILKPFFFFSFVSILKRYEFHPLGIDKKINF
jgi:hypothetical protein